MRIGVLSSGIFWQDFGMRQSGFPYDLLYVYEDKWDLEDYDVLIVPKGIDQEYLKSNAKKFARWLESGGVIVSFGESDGNWQPATSWKPSTVGQTTVLTMPDHLLFEGLSEAEIHPWSKAVHGYFDQVPKAASILATVTDEPQRVIAYVDDSTRKGAIMAMTYDPDYHTYSEIAFAKRMLHNSLSWACDTARRIRFEESKDKSARLPSLWKAIVARIGPGMLFSVLAGLGIALLFRFYQTPLNDFFSKLVGGGPGN